MTAQPRHVPERSCVACRRKRPQGEFVRVTRTAEGWRVLGGQRTGRGAYVCADSPECWAEKRLRRAFRGDAPGVSAALLARHSGPNHPNSGHPNPTHTATDQPMTP
ncbi:YlxR family protein [Deinococcus planocerae]|uniref:YlxR family protein n=1 Tax=Deinococcus planocerae TaxID=1737569 RepID=UPI000C7F6748|nr:YlxR family protein [Deinococcus planocerae]